MANEFLLLKWKKAFHTADINKDSVLTLEDADIFSENFARFHNMNAEDAEKVKRGYRRFYKEWVMRGLDLVDEKTNIENSTKAYLEDKDEFRAHTRYHFALVMDLIDINHDKLISEKEFEAMSKCTNYNTFDKKFMKAFPQTPDGQISLDVYLDAFVEFMCNPDKTNIKVEKPFHYGFGMIDAEPEEYANKSGL